MSRRVIQGMLLAAVLLAIGYLSQVDWNSKIEADVSSLIPDDDSAETKVFRSLISDRQGRIVYLKAVLGEDAQETGDLVSEMVVKNWTQSPIVKSIERYDEGSFQGFMSYAGKHRIELLFPEWFADKRLAYDQSEGDEPFGHWLSRSVESDLDQFLESPEAMELAREGIVDPLLLVVRAILKLEGSGQFEGAESDPSKVLFWIELSESPLQPKTQEALAQLVSDTSSKLAASGLPGQLEYAGLARLAEASRNRIHRDIGKVNGISFGLVLAVSLLLVRPPWRLLYALPVMGFSLLSGLVATLLSFNEVSVVVVVIGSILIGTSIDYAFHTLFSDGIKRGGTRKLLTIACGSTVVGFAILIAADMPVIRQIGVFVGSGLVGAFFASMALPAKDENVARMSRNGSGNKSFRRIGFASLAIWLGVLLIGIVFVPRIQWKEDIRNLEAPNPSVVANDLSLRGEFGANASGQAFFAMGSSYLEALQEQKEFLSDLMGSGVPPDVFSPSQLLPSSESVRLVAQFSDEIPNWLNQVEERLLESGYEGDRFGRFFDEARAFASTESEREVEDHLALFSERLTGPLALAMGEGNGEAWVVSVLEGDIGRVDAVLESHPSVVRLSQKEMLDKSLAHLRDGILKHGIGGMLAVSAVVLIWVRPRRGMLVLSVPAFAVLIALVVGMTLGGTLNLFHLIACLLGGVISLDYALFAVDALDDGRRVPFSVWLSGATTGASFLALSTSYIGGVRDLGLTVFAVTASSLVLVFCLQKWGRLNLEK